ncbi:MAG: hypothetical protein WD267_12765 [Balneolales bacterium]
MNWGEANRQFKLILNTLLHSDIHLIACLTSDPKPIMLWKRMRMAKTVPRKIGLAPIMRDGAEYEFTTVFNLDSSHQAMASKDRTGLFTDKIFQITEETGNDIANWLKKVTSKKLLQ